ncbi:stress-related protein [Diospyros lotus]|uniref:stress-related protein n=1 Tax=Diospyros lotus TaxID=55363 RepID=UPI00224F4888|nr:stress-related protein [Diospyros lotus]
MAESSEANQPTETVEDNRKMVKHLDFVQVAAIYIVVCISSLYEYARENSGPLKPGVQTVEATVKTVISPVYEKFHDVPFELLKFVDRKVDESINELDRHTPSLLKQALNQAVSAARAVASEVQRVGLVEAASNLTKKVYTEYEPTAKELYTKFEPVAEQKAVSAWRSLNKIPLFPQLAGIMVPTAVYWTEKYNQSVVYTADRGYPVAGYLPLVPIERIAKIFEEAEHGPSVSTRGEAVAQ